MTPVNRSYLEQCSVPEPSSLIEMAVGAGLAGPTRRRILMRGIPLEIVARIRRHALPFDQLVADLDALREAPRAGDGRPVLAVWCDNAALLLSQDRAGSTFRKLAEIIRLGPLGATHLRPEMAWIPTGEATLGPPPGQSRRHLEAPHKILTMPSYLMATTPVTRSQYQKVMMTSDAPLMKIAGNLPMVRIRWWESAMYCNALSMAEGLKPAYRMHVHAQLDEAADGYRLPSELEWEYACRSGTETVYWCGDDPALLADVAWFSTNSGVTVQAVGLKRANGWGLYDMHGNVWEWTGSWLTPSPSRTSPEAQAPASPHRTIRGGSCRDDAFALRSAMRTGRRPDEAHGAIGFRIMRPIFQMRQSK